MFEPEPWHPRPARGRGWFDFCKTARKPYDAAVCACLVAFRHHFGGAFAVSSDGDDYDAGWVAARTACQAVLGYGDDFSLVGPFEPAGPALVCGGENRGGWREHPFRDVRGRLAVCDPGRGWVEDGDTPDGVRLAAAVGPGWRVAVYGVDPATGRYGLRCLCGTVGEGRWRAGLDHIAHVAARERAAGFEPFIAGLAESPGDWAGVAARCDFLDDQGGRGRLLLPVRG